MTIDFSHIPKHNNVYYLTQENPDFSDIYLEVRKKEKRVLTDDEVTRLPYLARNEWPHRIKSTERFANYIIEKKSTSHIAAIGCGNGWFSHKIAEVSANNTIIGIDINKMELEQAARVFKKQNLYFAYADIFECADIFKNQLDIIVLNGAIQYFEYLQKLILLLKSFLKPKGEIHIIDSPFYCTSDIIGAKERTKSYYSELGFPEMAKNYHHHDLKHVSNFDVLYKKENSLLDKILGKKDSPFSWYRLTK